MSIQYCALSWDISEFRILISPSRSLLIHQSGNCCHFDQEFLQNKCLFDLRCLKCYLFYSNAALKWAFNIHDFHPKMPLLVDQKFFLTPFKNSGALPAYCSLISHSPTEVPLMLFSREASVWPENTESYSRLLVALQRVLWSTSAPHEVTSVNRWDCIHFIVSLLWAPKNVIAF